MLKEFKGFVLRGNVVDLAVGVVIGAAFGAVVTSFVENVLTPVIAIPGTAEFGDWSLDVGGSSILYGRFLNDVISFVLVAAAVFFLVVRPVNALMARRKTERDVVSESKQCPECLSNIPKAAKRCAFCTTPQQAS
ncbi:MAG TPA: large conductance mechanosensitive channel protein MscL [Actinomycetota bacterium]|nr:large conductance mechanosensitive channel protein MscL [Actinomycetota bacterium]